MPSSDTPADAGRIQYFDFPDGRGSEYHAPDGSVLIVESRKDYFAGAWSFKHSPAESLRKIIGLRYIRPKPAEIYAEIGPELICYQGSWRYVVKAIDRSFPGDLQFAMIKSHGRAIALSHHDETLQLCCSILGNPADLHYLRLAIERTGQDHLKPIFNQIMAELFP